MSTRKQNALRILAGMPEQGSQGGPAACEPPFIAELRRLGHEVEEGIYAYAESSSGLRRRVTRVLRSARLFKERIQRGNFDIVHLNTSFDTKALLRDSVIVPRLHVGRTKIFLKFHGSDAELLRTTNPVLAIARRRLLAHTDGIGVLSSEEQENFRGAGVPAEKLFVIKNVVESSSQLPNIAFRKHMKLAEDLPLLLFIGRFIPAKGLLDVVRAAGLLRDQGQEFLLLCLGDGPARREAEQEVARLQLQNQVRFFGYIPEAQTPNFYLNSTLLLFPTYHYEGFPMVIFNAAAAGLPIITTRIRAAADYLRDPANCVWVQPQRPDLLAEAISRLLADHKRREEMSANNRQLALQFSAEIVTQEYLAAYGRLQAGT